ncbi:hypothetical protein [Aquimarina sp. 2201CG5-10]|uniref:helix-turn-helix and ligand-binding sensor domain-containing protein n=1 Tax=Aquimarina callyspongiae TaxID=3098150 RepID=UPI002AB5D88A|nr:hypothetical protein [Aquimarina sp. 2201CG5-10]MDY8134358.1 hypothetical protein [Aquimarina sp. 2201CG5-10]
MEKSNFEILFLFLALFFGLCFSSSAQIFNPEIENYSIQDYGADNQNWGIDVDEDGLIYIANNKGLLRYNGTSWELLELPNKTIVRSVLCVEDKIYTGSYEEFGYWERDDLGNFKYTSLIPAINKTHDFSNEQFWQIISHNEEIFLKSYTGGIYKYSNGNVQYLAESADSYDLATYDNKVIVANRNRGLLQVQNEKLVPFDITGYRDYFKNVNNLASNKELLFFFDLNKGGFLYNNKSLKTIRLPEEINKFLQEKILNKVVFINPDELAFGTIKEGIVIYNIKTKNHRYINTSKGLKNNTVLGLKNNKGFLLTALDDGLSVIDYNSPFAFYTDYSGILGTVYDIAFFKGRYFLASNTGIYKISDSGEPILIQGTEDHVWDLNEIEGQLIAGHNEGSFIIEDGNLLKKVGETGVFCTVKIPDSYNKYLQGTYYSINFLEKDNNGWKSVMIGNIPFPVNDIVFESKYVIWATHPYKGVYRIRLDESYSKVLKIVNYSDNQNFKQYRTRVFNINDTIAFYNSNTWFQYFKDKDSVGLFNKFQKFNGKNLILKNKGEGWLIDENNSGDITYFNNNYEEILKVDVPEIKRRLVSGYEKIINKNDSLKLLNLNEGFTIFNVNKLKKREIEIAKSPVINKIYSNRKQFSIRDSILHFPFKDGQYLSFEIYTPGRYKNIHSYSLSGEIEQKELVKNGKLTLQNLDYGDYFLSIKNEDIGSKKSKIKNLYFRVLPPWYLSKPLKAVYFLMFLSILFLIYKINKRRVKKQRLELKKLHIRKTQKRISELEKQNLEKEIKTKKRELMNTTDSIIRKNETIMVLLNELERLENVSPNQIRTRKILNTSKKDISGTNDWKVFESNFNELNQEFFKRLIEMHPKLTTKDLRLCAYIKTGLTSKKIAPLMGITVRGVELQRYRLRKKLSISVNDNLTNFLRSF